MYCKVPFGSCGGTAGAIYAMAGVGEKSCLTSTAPECRNHENAGTVVEMKSGRRLRSIMCVDKAKCCSTSYIKDCTIDNTGCTDDKATGAKMIVEMMQKDVPGWPDSWADKLQPGDIMWIWNGNAECGGLHSALFIGWAKEPGWANVVQGSINIGTFGGSLCVKASCLPNIQPLIRIFRKK